jgi:hypothetical protein
MTCGWCACPTADGEELCSVCRRWSEATPDLTCAICGRKMSRSSGSLPQGKATCQPCRRKAPTYVVPRRPFRSEVKACEGCGRPYETRTRTQRYCSPECRAERRRSGEHASSSARGYGTEHQRERRRWARVVAQGIACCCLCGHPILPGTPWHLDHTPDRSGYRGVAHAVCNLSDGARRGNRMRRRPR